MFSDDFNPPQYTWEFYDITQDIPSGELEGFDYESVPVVFDGGMAKAGTPSDPTVEGVFSGSKTTDLNSIAGDFEFTVNFFHDLDGSTPTFATYSMVILSGQNFDIFLRIAPNLVIVGYGDDLFNPAEDPTVIYADTAPGGEFQTTDIPITLSRTGDIITVFVKGSQVYSGSIPELESPEFDEILIAFNTEPGSDVFGVNSIDIVGDSADSAEVEFDLQPDDGYKFITESLPSGYAGFHVPEEIEYEIGEFVGSAGTYLIHEITEDGMWTGVEIEIEAESATTEFEFVAEAGWKFIRNDMPSGIDSFYAPEELTWDGSEFDGPDGTYTYYVIDDSAMWEAQEVVIEEVVVPTPPQGTVTIGTPNVDETTVTISVSYSESDHTGFEYRLDSGTPVSFGDDSQSLDLVLSEVEEGTYDVEVRAVNADGSSDWSVTESFTVEVAEPEPEPEPGEGEAEFDFVIPEGHEIVQLEEGFDPFAFQQLNIVTPVAGDWFVFPTGDVEITPEGHITTPEEGTYQIWHIDQTGLWTGLEVSSEGVGVGDEPVVTDESATTSFTMVPPEGHSVVTLQEGFDDFAFQNLTVVTPQAGDMFLYPDEHMEISADGVVTVNTEDTFLLWHITPNAMYTALEVDSLNLEESGDVIGDISVSSVETTETVFRITFDYDGSGQDGFEYRIDNGDWVFIGGSMEFTVTDLSADTLYTVEIRAVHSDDFSAIENENVTTLASGLGPDIGVVNIHTITTSESSIEIFFDYSGSGEDGFQYRYEGGEWIFTTETDFIIEDLEEDSPYFIEIRAVHGIEYSDIVSGSFVTEEPEEPEDPDIGVVEFLTDVTDTTITVTIDTYTGEGEDGFEVRINGVGWVFFDVDYTYTDLHPDTDYLIEVRAVHGGQYSEIVSETVSTAEETLDIGSINIVDVVTSENSFTVLFDYSGSGEDHYEYRVNGGAWNVTHSQTINQTGLNPDTSYTVEIRAVHGFEYSPVLTESVMTDEEIPEPVDIGDIIIVFTDQTETMFEVEFDYTGSGVEAFEYRLDGGNWETTLGTMITYTDLTPDTTYVVEIRANHGNGVYSSAESVTIVTDETDVNIIGNIVDLAVTATPTTATVEFDYTGEGEDGFQYSLNNGTWLMVQQVPFILTGLSPETSYTIAVRAYHDVDTSNPTSASFSTQEQPDYDLIDEIHELLRTQPISRRGMKASDLKVITEKYFEAKNPAWKISYGNEKFDTGFTSSLIFAVTGNGIRFDDSDPEVALDLFNFKVGVIEACIQYTGKMIANNPMLNSQIKMLNDYNMEVKMSPTLIYSGGQLRHSRLQFAINTMTNVDAYNPFDMMDRMGELLGASWMTTEEAQALYAVVAFLERVRASSDYADGLIYESGASLEDSFNHHFGEYLEFEDMTLRNLQEAVALDIFMS